MCLLNYNIGLNLLNNEKVAIKFEPRDCEAPQLKDEYRAYKILAGTGSLRTHLMCCIIQYWKKKYFHPLAGIPNAYYFGNEKTHNILVIDLLGPSLEDMFDMCERKFSIKTVAILAIQMVLKSIQLPDLINSSFYFLNTGQFDAISSWERVDLSRRQTG